MREAGLAPDPDAVRRLPRGRHALPPATVREDQRRRLLAAIPGVAAERGYAAMSVADLVRAAAVSRNAFYANFANKRECFAAAVEDGHERLFAVLAEPCDRRASLGERLEARLGAALELLAKEPELARLLFVEAVAAGREEALRQHEWLRRCAQLLRAAVPDGGIGGEAELIAAGGLATRIATELLGRSSPNLRLLTPGFVAFLLAIYAPAPGAFGPAEEGLEAASPATSEAVPSVAQPRRAAS